MAVWLMADESSLETQGSAREALIVDSGLYMSRKQDIFYVSRRRELPTAFKLFTGSAWVALSRDLVEYFQTVLCSAPRFVPTVANHDQWDVPPRQHPHALTLADRERMVSSNAPFARKFARDDPVLDAIDDELLLGRGRNGSTSMFVHGGWCGAGGVDCGVVGDDSVLRPGPGAAWLEKLMDRIVRSAAFANSQCK